MPAEWLKTGYKSPGQNKYYNWQEKYIFDHFTQQAAQESVNSLYRAACVAAAVAEG